MRCGLLRSMISVIVSLSVYLSLGCAVQKRQTDRNAVLGADSYVLSHIVLDGDSDPLMASGFDAAVIKLLTLLVGSRCTNSVQAVK